MNKIQGIKDKSMQDTVAHAAIELWKLAGSPDYCNVSIEQFETWNENTVFEVEHRFRYVAEVAKLEDDTANIEGAYEYTDDDMKDITIV